MDANGAKNVQKYMYLLNNRADGGKGSGNWGHAGRIGQIGGSSGKGAGSGIANRLETPDGGYASLSGAYKENEKRNKAAEKSKETSGAVSGGGFDVSKVTGHNESENAKEVTKSLSKVRELASDADAQSAFAEPKIKFGFENKEAKENATAIIKQFPKEWVSGAVENGGKVEISSSPVKSVYSETNGGSTKTLSINGKTTMESTNAVATWLVKNNPYLKSVAADLGARGEKQLINGLTAIYTMPSRYNKVSSTYMPDLSMDKICQILAAGK